MKQLEQISLCPICDGNEFSSFLQCKDYTVSGEFFNIEKCKTCDFLLTNPRPSLDSLGDYYKAEAYISHTDSSKGLVNKLYKIARKLTLKRKFAIIKNHLKGKPLLDIGSGTGAFLSYCKGKDVEVVGVEPDSEARQVAKDNYGIQAYPEEALEAFGDSRFSVITMWHVLEHVPFLKQRIKEINRLLDAEGRVYIAVPNHLSRDASYYGKFWAAYDVPRHLSHFSPSTIERLFSGQGFTLESTLPMKLDAFYVSMLSEKYKTGNSGVIIGAWNGLKSNLAAGSNKWSSQIYIFRKTAQKT